MGTSLFRRKWTTGDFVLILMVAALYAGAIALFAQVKLIPQVPIRPANALQPVFGLLFGIPGCIGLGIGNLVSDLMMGSTAPHVLAAGFVANFLGGFIAYVFVKDPSLKEDRSYIHYIVFVVLLASVVVSCTILINVALGLTPKEIVPAYIRAVFLNQAIATAVLGPILLKLLYPFVHRTGLYRGRQIGSGYEERIHRKDPHFR
ncbi:MAG: QueT transporter family protein [Clostridia bacterium]